MLFAMTNPAAPSHWLRKKYLLRAAEVDLRNWHFTLEELMALSAEANTMMPITQPVASQAPDAIAQFLSCSPRGPHLPGPQQQRSAR